MSHEKELQERIKDYVKDNQKLPEVMHVSAEAFCHLKFNFLIDSMPTFVDGKFKYCYHGIEILIEEPLITDRGEK